MGQPRSTSHSQALGSPTEMVTHPVAPQKNYTSSRWILWGPVAALAVSRMSTSRKRMKTPIMWSQLLTDVLVYSVLQYGVFSAHTPAILTINWVTWLDHPWLLRISCGLTFEKGWACHTMSMTCSSRSTPEIPFLNVLRLFHHIQNPSGRQQGKKSDMIQAPFSSEKFPMLQSFAHSRPKPKLVWKKTWPLPRVVDTVGAPLVVTPEAAKPYTVHTECCTFSRHVVFGMHMFPAVTHTNHLQVESRVAPQISGNDPHGFPNWPTLIPRLNARKKSHHQELTQLDTPALNQTSVQVIYFRKKRHAFAIWYALQIQYLFFFWRLSTTCGVATHARIQHMLRAMRWYAFCARVQVSVFFHTF